VCSEKKYAERNVRRKCQKFPTYKKDIYFEWCKFSECNRYKFSHLPNLLKILHICVVFFVCNL
jgi:hypothetical protein